VGPNDGALIVDKFEAFVHSRKSKPFLALLHFHNNHIPFVATAQGSEACIGGQCKRQPGDGPWDPDNPSKQLDYFGSLVDIDVQIGRVRRILNETGYAPSTLVWLASDNGPEVNVPSGFTSSSVAGGRAGGPGEARPLRGRKRDYWEGGHRIPGVIEYPPLIKANRVSEHTMVTTDLLPTVMELLGLSTAARPASQAGWGLDGRSVVPALRGEPAASFNQFGRGWLFWRQPSALGGAYRYGDWKLVNQSHSCQHGGPDDGAEGGTTEDTCRAAMYNLKDDLGETTDLSTAHPDIFAAMAANMTVWKWHVINSSLEESKCETPFPPGPEPPHSTHPPAPAPALLL
jgi:arylsulfatase A-like enzyme